MRSNHCIGTQANEPARLRRCRELFLLLTALSALAAGAAAHAAEVALTAPAEAVVGSDVEVTWSGGENPQDFITIVPPSAAEGKYDAHQYARQSPVKLTAPVMPGSYEIRYLSAATPYPTLARRAITIIDASATLEAPDSVAAGSAFEVGWIGPDNQRDFITVVAAGTAEGKYGVYTYTDKGSPLKLTAPDAAGDYEIRYLMGQQPYRTLGSRPVKVVSSEAKIEAPKEIAAGAAFSFTWQGPDNPQDYITIVPQDAADNEYAAYVYTEKGSPAELTAPDIPGAYEVRYLTGQSDSVLARTAITVTSVSASVSGPATVEAKSAVTVTWEGPGNELDYIIIQPVGAEPGASGPYAYTRRGEELRIETPAEPGEYEYRYLTGQSQQVLAAQAVTVVARPVPGRLRVVDAAGGAAPQAAGGAAASQPTATVSVVLDASGSMLARIDGRPRIDIAKEALTKLIADDLPADARFSLHVFGHKEASSCRTDVEIPLGALDRTAAKAKVASINAMNLAKTPIGATLEKAGAALAGQSGPHLIILLTDGEETCGGDPAAVIESLTASGHDVRVNIVGFAIDELMLRETFEEWARLGNGTYLDARSAEELTAGLAYAIEVPFEVRNAAGEVVASGVVNGPAVELPAGEYQVQPAVSETPMSATIKADEETVLTLDQG